jgi:hypothetical protein
MWCAVAKTKKSKPRLCQCGPLTGFLLFIKTNVPLANRGLAQVDLPLEYLRVSPTAVAARRHTSGCDQGLVGPALFLRAHQLLGDWRDQPRELVAGQSP